MITIYIQQDLKYIFRYENRNPQSIWWWIRVTDTGFQQKIPIDRILVLDLLEAYMQAKVPAQVNITPNLQNMVETLQTVKVAARKKAKVLGGVA